MKSIDAFNSIFDRKALRPVPDRWSATESDKSANFTCVSFLRPGRLFYPISRHFIKPDSIVHHRSGRHLSDRNCDGACVWYEGDETGREEEILMMVELKSKFSDSEIRGAFMQTLYSFLRVHMAMSLCEGYDLASRRVRMCVACQTFDDASFAKVLASIDKALQANLEGFRTKILRYLIRGKSVEIKLRKLLEYYNISLNLPKGMLDKTLSLHMYLTGDVADSSLEVEL